MFPSESIVNEKKMVILKEMDATERGSCFPSGYQSSWKDNLNPEAGMEEESQQDAVLLILPTVFILILQQRF